MPAEIRCQWPGEAPAVTHRTAHTVPDSAYRHVTPDPALIRGGRRDAPPILFHVLWLVLALGIVEALSFVVIALSPWFTREEIRRTTDIFREQTEKIQALLAPSPKLLQLDPELGWRYRASYQDMRNQMNSRGVRSNREYARVPDPANVRVAAFGDSFVYCNEVTNEESWPSLLEATFPGFEVLNYGVGGYGTDQAYLRYLMEGSALSPDVVIIGFAPVNLRRAVNVYRRFISNRELPLIKPRFVLASNGELVLRPNPARQPSDYAKYLSEPRRVVELGREDQWYEPGVYENPLHDYSATLRVILALWAKVNRRYVDPDRLLHGHVFNPSSTAFKIQTAIFEHFNNAVLASGATPIVVIFPDQDALQAARNGNPRVFDPLVAHLRTKGIAVVDLTESLLAGDPDVEAARLFMSSGHYSPLGNRRVAARLGSHIEETIRARRPASRPAVGEQQTALLVHREPR